MVSLAVEAATCSYCLPQFSCRNNRPVHYFGASFFLLGKSLAAGCMTACALDKISLPTEKMLCNPVSLAGNAHTYPSEEVPSGELLCVHHSKNWSSAWAFRAYISEDWEKVSDLLKYGKERMKLAHHQYFYSSCAFLPACPLTAACSPDQIQDDSKSAYPLFDKSIQHAHSTAGPFLTAGHSTSPSGQTDLENAFKKRKLLELSGDGNLYYEGEAGSIAIPNTLSSTVIAPASPESPAKEVFTEASPTKSTLEQRSDAGQVDDGYR